MEKEPCYEYDDEQKCLTLWVSNDSFATVKHGDVVHKRAVIFIVDHYAIYDGSTNTFLEFVGNTTDGVKFVVGKQGSIAYIRETSPVQFLTNVKKLVVEKYEECLPPDEVIARARSQLGKGGFDPLFCNCEHFANWCKTGKAGSSSQLKSLTKKGVLVGALLFPFMPAVAMGYTLGLGATTLGTVKLWEKVVTPDDKVKLN